MSATNARIAQKIESMVVTMEILANQIRVVSTSSFENTMNGTKVQAVKDKLDVVETKLGELHNLIQDAAASSSDLDVAYRSGGGNGK